MGACYDPAHEPVPEDPAKVTGPEVGTLQAYVDKRKGRIVVRVLARSYVWAPEQHHPSGYHGYRRYDWTVIQYGPSDQQRVVVDDVDLSPVELGDIVSKPYIPEEKRR